MEKILALQNRHWNGSPYQGLFARRITGDLLRKLSLKEAQVLTGIRRSGKSTIFRLLINHLMTTVNPRSILYLNLDDPFFSEVCRDAKELYRIVETAEKLTGEKVRYLFLDEVQNVSEWQKFVKSVYDAELFAKILLTGSNAALLADDYAVLLSGRYVRDTVYPLTFQELLDLSGIGDNLLKVTEKPRVLALVEQMLQFGSFPEVIKISDPELKRDALASYYETILLKDCIANSGIRDVKRFKLLTHYLMSNVGAPYSYNSLARGVGGNENTISQFVATLNNSYLLCEVINFSYSLKEQSKARRKCYCMDNGIMNAVSFAFSENRGKLFENLVFSELYKRGNEMYFHLEQKECDYIVKRGNSLIGIQVCRDLTEMNRKREMDGLTVAMKKHNLQRGIVVTYDQEEPDDGRIAVVPFWKTDFDEINK